MEDLYILQQLLKGSIYECVFYKNFMGTGYTYLQINQFNNPIFSVTYFSMDNLLHKMRNVKEDSLYSHQKVKDLLKLFKPYIRDKDLEKLLE